MNIGDWTMNALHGKKIKGLRGLQLEELLIDVAFDSLQKANVNAYAAKDERPETPEENFRVDPEYDERS